MSATEHELRALVGDAAIGDPGDARWWRDATEAQGLEGRPNAVVLPADAEQVRAVVAWCCQHDVPIVPRGGGSGFSGGACRSTAASSSHSTA